MYASLVIAEYRLGHVIAIQSFPPINYSILKSIGFGHFGTVRKGVWFTNDTCVQVAIKSVKNSMEQERVKLLQEAAIMGQFAHSSVVRLLGVVTVGEPVSMGEGQRRMGASR